jgi:hypothetical protein
MAIRFTGRDSGQLVNTATGKPHDWDDPVIHRGFSKLVGGGYSVRLSVGGKQLNIGIRYSQADAAALYDLAVWKFAPKMSRKPKLNFPDEFEFTNQDMVDRECPRLNELYLETPYLSLRDEAIAESHGVESLRLRALKGEVAAPTRNLSSFNSALSHLKSLRGHLLVASGELESQRFGLAYLHKLSKADGLWQDMTAELGDLCARIQQIESSMEEQRAYYQKLADDPSNAI